MIKIFLSLIFSGVFLLVGASSALAATYYVAPSGNDNNSGTEAAPWKTFARAFDSTKAPNIKAGDTLLAKNGTYNEAIVRIPSGESWNKPVTIKSQNPRGAIIRPSTPVDAALGIRYGDGKIPRRYITVEGFVFDCVYALNRCVHIAGALDESIIDVRDIRIINNEIKNAGEAKRAQYNSSEIYGAGTQGILNTRADYVEYINNDIHDNGVTDYDHGIYQGGGNNILIEGNRVYNNRGSGIKIGWTSPTADNTARYNLVYDNNTAWTFGDNFGKKKQGRCISTHDARRTKIYNNICIGAHVSGIDVIYEDQDVEVYNNTVIVTGSNAVARGISVGGSPGSNSILVKNTIVKNNIVYQANTLPSSQSNSAIQVGVASSNTTVQNNLLFGTNTNISIETTAPRNVSNNTVADPQFMNFSARDFRLKSSSPAINKGATISLFNDDFVRVRRPAGSAYDVGAYEFGGTPTTPTQTPVSTVTPQATPTRTPIATATAVPSVKPGDANGDNKVDSGDYIIWLREFTQRQGVSSDFNKDGKVDGVDLTIWLLNYGK